MISQTKKMTAMDKCTYNACHFDGNGDALV